MVEVEPRGLRAAGDGPKRGLIGRRTALVDKSKSVRRKESDIKERIEEREGSEKSQDR